MNARECPVKTMDKLALVIIEHFHITPIGTAVGTSKYIHTVVSSCTMSITLPHHAVEAERVNPGAMSSDSSSATGVGLFLGGVVAGVTGVLLIGGSAGGACRLRQSKHK